MTASKLAASLAGRVTEESNARIEAERAKLEAQTSAARAWDETVQGNPEVPAPYLLAEIMGRTVFYFKELNPDAALRLMAAIPAEPAGLRRGGRGTSYGPESRELREGETFEPGEPWRLGITQYGHSPSLLIEWDATLCGKACYMRAELLNVQGVTPRIAARAVLYGGNGPVSHYENVRLEWPEAVPKGARMHEIRYGSGSRDSLNPFLVWGDRDNPGSVRDWLQRCAAVCDARSRESRSAFLRDLANLSSIEPATPEGGDYDSQKLKAGTRAQFECLRTPEALRDRALAERHWREYCNHQGRKAERAYFDHYDWACRWLEVHSLLIDVHNGKPYKYGSAWL